MGLTPQGAAFLDRLSEEFLERFRRGDRPSAAEYADRHPEWSEIIRDRLTSLAARELMARHAPSAVASCSGEAPRHHESMSLSAPPGYRILRQVGHGGMGIVFDAIRTATGERVALKVLPFHRDICQVERFLQEARAARALDHPNIIPVSDVSEGNGCFSYYAMRFVEGCGLNEVVRALREEGRAAFVGPEAPREDAGRSIGLESVLAPPGSRCDCGGDRGMAPCTGGPPTAEELARRLRAGEFLPPDIRRRAMEQAGTPYYHAVAALIRQAADAIARAHEHKILHRDIKPSNLLLERTGHLWVADFGLAKLEEGKDLTRTGDLLGTYRYMAPERFGHQSDPRGDIYSLGITLHEMLTLRPAFEEADCPRLIERVRHEDPPRPRQLDYRIPRDLETIVLSATAKSPGDRYVSAAKFRDDLDRFLAREPIAARPLPAYRRAWRWSQRRPLDAALIVALATVLVVGFMLVFHKWREAVEVNRALADQIQVARSTSDQLRRSVAQLGATERLLRLEQRLALIRQAYSDLRAHRGAAARSRLDELAATGMGADVVPAPTDFLFSLVDNIAHSECGQYASPAESAFAVAFDQSGRWLACAGGSRAGEGLDDGALAVWEDGRLLWKLGDLPESVIALAFRPEGTDLAALTTDLSRPGSAATLRVWDVATRRERWSVPAGPSLMPGSAFASLEYSPDGRSIAAIGDGGRLVFRDAGDGHPLPGRSVFPRHVGAFALAPAGDRVALSAEGGKALVLAEPAGGRIFWKVEAQEEITDLEFHPGGDLLATATSEGTVELRRLGDGSPIRSLSEPSRRVRRIAFRGDGLVLATAGDDGSARLWSVPGLHPLAVYSGHDPLLHSVAFHPGGRFLASVGEKDGVKLWDATASPGPLVLPSRGGGRRVALAVAADNATVVTSRVGHPLECWDVRTTAKLATLPVPSVCEPGGAGPSCPVAIASRAGVALMIPSHRPDSGCLLDWSTGRVRAELCGGHGAIRAVAIAADGSRAATASWSDHDHDAGKLLLWSGDAGWCRPRRLEVPGGRVHSLAFDPDGGRIAGAVSFGEGPSPRSRLCVWSCDTGKVVRSWEGISEDCACEPVWSPDGSRLAICGGERALLVEADSGRVRAEMQVGAGAHALAFHPVEPLLAIAYRRGVALHHLELGRGVLELDLPMPIPKDAGPPIRVAFSLDGTQLVVAHGNGEIAIWDASPRTDEARHSRYLADGRTAALWYWRQFRQAAHGGDEFAARFHRERFRNSLVAPLQQLATDRALAVGALFPLDGDADDGGN